MTTNNLPPSLKSIKICEVPDCGKPYSAKNLCVYHYDRHIHGYTIVPLTRENLFWLNIAVAADPNVCWPWQSSVDKDGYGVFAVAGKKGAHRYAYFLEHGQWPDPCCLHSCDNPPCCNPNHLRAGTRADNHDDAVRKGRHVYGSKVVFAKLDETKVREIWKLLKQGMMKVEIARRFRVDPDTISRIVHRHTWKQVTPPE